MEPLITVADLETRLGSSLGETESAQAEALIDDASALVRDVAEDDFINDDGALDVPPEIVPVVATMVRRSMENPLGRTGETLGDYSWQQQPSGGAGMPATLYPTRREKRIIRRAAKKLSVGTMTLEGYLPHGGNSYGSWLDGAM